MLVRVIKSFKDKNDNSIIYPVNVLIDFFDKKRCQDLIKRELVVEEKAEETKEEKAEEIKEEKAEEIKEEKAEETKDKK